MVRPRRALGLGAVAVALAAPLAACSSDDSSTTATGGAPESADVSTTVPAAPINTGAEVAIDDFAYEPETVTVKANEALTWRNDDTAKHTVTARPEQAIDFKSETLQTGDTFVQTFATPGTYTYFCSIHGDRMTGSIVVE